MKMATKQSKDSGHWTRNIRKWKQKYVHTILGPNRFPRWSLAAVKDFFVLYTNFVLLGSMENMWESSIQDNRLRGWWIQGLIIESTVLVSWSILAEDWTNFHDGSGRLQVFCLERIPEQPLHLRGKCIIQDLRFHCTTSMFNWNDAKGDQLQLIQQKAVVTVRKKTLWG